MAINLRQIEAFRAVMVTGSATEAAKMLFITQPAISRLISDLEYRTNLNLFDRKPNRLVPTFEAHTLFRDVDRAFIGLDEIQRSAEAIANKQEGSLRIVAMPVCVDSFLPSVIADFVKQHPNVSIELETAPRIQALELVRTQRLDLGIVSLRRKEDIGMQVQGFCQQQAVCALPAGHRLRGKGQIQAKDLEGEPFISLSRGSPFRAQIDEIFSSEHIKRIFTLETRTQLTVYELVKRGAGIAILDPFITDAEDEGVVIKPFIPAINWEYSIVQPHSASPSLITQSFIELLKSHFE